ncbi:phage tail protein [Pseudoalteromonas sp. GB56]
MWGFSWPPRGWQQCDGQLMPISQNQALFSLIGTIYGGDGRSTFALPDLRGRAPMHAEGGILAWVSKWGLSKSLYLKHKCLRIAMH